jgi:hypothetical protein
MVLGKRVRLVTFNGTKVPEGDCDPSENYWKLIGAEGVIIEDRTSGSGEGRLLVQFAESVSALGLHCHNEVANSLWIRQSDLKNLI